MKRSGISLSEVADFDNLASAFYAAAKGKSQHPDVARFGRELDKQLALMQAEILDGSIKLGDMTTFLIRDPKLRLIHAPCFRERVLHHAVMALVGPVLDRGLVFDTYACRKRKGTLAAVLRCQHFIRRHPIFVKIDIRSYFPNIDHEHLNERLAHCFKDRNLLNLLARIIACCQAAPGKGLPIGALTSQHFANFYLGQLDRLLLEECRASGMVRYMDDVIWWCGSREAARTTLQIVEEFVTSRLRLEIKQPRQIGRSVAGVMFCGFKILPNALRLSQRRRKRYSARRRYWETAYVNGAIDALALQAGYSSALAITGHADATAWRRGQLRRSPIAEALLML